MRDQSILPKEPLALETRLPIRDIQRSWTAQKIPSQLSNTAGLYLCNQVMFTSLAWLSEAVPSGFIHLPPDENLAAMKAQPYMPLEVQARAVGVALKITLKGLASSQLNN